MKKFLLPLLLLFTLTLTACGIPFTAVEQEDEGSPADLEAFFSLEEFVFAIETQGDGAALSMTFPASFNVTTEEAITYCQAETVVVHNGE